MFKSSNCLTRRAIPFAKARDNCEFILIVNGGGGRGVGKITWEGGVGNNIVSVIYICIQVNILTYIAMCC